MAPTWWRGHPDCDALAFYRLFKGVRPALAVLVVILEE